MYLGVDPGKTGAFVILDEKRELKLMHAFPGTPHEVKELLRPFRKLIKLAVLENVHAFKKQGVSSVFTFGTNFGMWQGLLAGMNIPYALVAPRVWQAAIWDSAKKGKDPKAVTMAFIKRRFPQLKLKRSQHNEADAFCIALYARMIDTEGV